MGSDKTAVAEALCHRLRDAFSVNDIYIYEVGESLTRRGALPPEHIADVETGEDSRAATFSSELPVIDRIELGPYAGANLEEMDREARHASRAR